MYRLYAMWSTLVLKLVMEFQPEHNGIHNARFELPTAMIKYSKTFNITINTTLHLQTSKYSYSPAYVSVMFRGTLRKSN
jgi:hypothetical protein